MPVLSSPTLDLSRLPAPDVIETLSFEDLLNARIARLRIRFDEHDVAFSADRLESEPAVILQEEDAYRQLLDRQRVNDALRAVLPASAKGADLEAIALRAGVLRQIVTPATQIAPAVYETDARLLDRYLAAFGRPAAGSIDGYIYAAFTALPIIHDVNVIGPEVHNRPGRADVILLPKAGETLTSPQINTVRVAVNAKTVRPLTDEVTVRLATIVPFTVTATLKIPAGPDPEVVRAAALVQLRAFAAERYKLGVDSVLPANAIAAALYAPNVSRVILASPEADLPLAPDAVPRLTAQTLTVEVLS